MPRQALEMRLWSCSTVPSGRYFLASSRWRIRSAKPPRIATSLIFDWRRPRLGWAGRLPRRRDDHGLVIGPSRGATALVGDLSQGHAESEELLKFGVEAVVRLDRPPTLRGRPQTVASRGRHVQSRAT